MESIFIGVAFVAGMLVHLMGLPPLIGFLASGFFINALGYGSTQALETLADLGVTLLLFTIGLKLNIQTLLRREVWMTASSHLLLSTIFFTIIIILFKTLGLDLVRELNWNLAILLGFALSFSSTVFAVKVLEDRSEMSAFYGRIAIGILVMQDIFAVAYLTISTGKIPSPWAALVLLLPLARPIFYKILEKTGHGELQVLYGIFLALVVGAGGFSAVGLKPDLGALILGVILAPHPSSSGLAKSLFNLKELFLICFFLSVGMNGHLSWQVIILGALLVLVLPIKSFLYYLLLAHSRLRVRTNMLATLSLSNYSEFGLIVGTLAVKNHLLNHDWLLVISVALALSFLVAAPFNKYSESLYRRFLTRFARVESKDLLEEDKPIELGHAQIIVLGMGRIGQGAYQQLEEFYGPILLGVENSNKKVTALREQGLNVIEGDATDTDFWQKLTISSQVKLILLAMPHHYGNLYAIQQLKRQSFQGKVAAIVRYQDDITSLQEHGVDAVFNIYDEAGAGFARHVLRELQPF